MFSAETTGAIGADLELALRGLWEAAIAMERAAVETIGARREAMISIAAALDEAIGRVAALASVA